MPVDYGAVTHNGEERSDQMTHRPAVERPPGDRRLMVSASPSAYKIHMEVEHALDCFDTLKGNERLVESVVKSILRDLLTYLSNFDEANRILISKCSRVDDDGYEGPFEVDIGNVGNSEGAQSAGASSLDTVE